MLSVRLSVSESEGMGVIEGGGVGTVGGGNPDNTVEPHFNEHPRDQGLLFAVVGSVRSPGFPLNLALT